MKKLLLFLIVAPFYLWSQNDTLYYQDFENYHSGDMIMIDNDHLTPYFQGLESWIVSSKGYAISSSYYTDGDKTADDWMITPIIQLGDNPGLFWEAYTKDQSYPEGYRVLISTDVNNPTNLTSYHQVFSTSAEQTSWTQRAINLSDYANQQVRIAWQNNSTDKYLLFVDNILVLNRKNYDLAAIKSITPMFVKSGESFTPQVKIFNLGSENINNFNVIYQINDEQAVNKNFNKTINFGSIVTVSMPSYTPQKDTLYTIKFEISSPNGQTDQNTKNDSIIDKFSSYSAGEQNYLLLEHFTQASCAPCGQQNPTLNELLAKNEGKAIHIAYHTSWPGYDPMYDFNPTASDTRVNFYGISGVPTVVANGVNIGSPSAVTQNMIDENYVKNAPVKIELNCLKKHDTLFMAVNLIPHTFFPKSVKMYTVVIEDKHYKKAPGTNGEKDFPDVMRKMYPNENGETISNLKKDSVYTFEYIYKTQWEITLENSSFVVFIQDPETNEIIAVEQFDIKNATNIEDNNTKVDIYPNPANNFINITSTENIKRIKIFNSEGKIIYIKRTDNQKQENINISNFNDGIYLIYAETDKGTKFNKFIIKH